MLFWQRENIARAPDFGPLTFGPLTFEDTKKKDAEDFHEEITKIHEPKIGILYTKKWIEENL